MMIEPPALTEEFGMPQVIEVLADALSRLDGGDEALEAAREAAREQAVKDAHPYPEPS